MKKNKGLKKGMAMTATIALLVSNMSIAVPTIKAEEVSHIPLSQENANETEQVIVEPNSDAVKLESNLEDSTIISEEIKNENKTENEMNDDLDPSITEPDRQSENNTKESTSKTVIDSTNGQIQEKSTVEQMNSLEQLEERTTSEEQEETIDYQSLPSLLITEIMPNNTGADDYEYFEVYNNTNQPIVLDHYTFSLRYTDGSGKADVDMQFAPTTLAPKESIVFWHNSNQKTLDDFNSHYQTTLSQNQVVEFSGTPNFYNSGNRAVVIKDMAGKDLIIANYLKDDIGDGQVVQYKSPLNGLEMETFETKAQPTPGSFMTEQVPEQEVQLAVNQAPVITHEQITTASAKEDLALTATISDDLHDVSAYIYYQTEQNSEYQKIKMVQKDGQIYQASIPKESLTNQTLRYYISVTDSNHRVSYPDSNSFVEVSIEDLEEIDYDSLPPLLITELSPNSKGGGTDYFEYFELYNNSNQPQLLTNYSFIYQYTDTGRELPFQIPAVTIEPQETLVFWFNNGGKSLADFNEHFGSQLTNEQVVEFTDVFPGFANGGNRALVLKDNQGEEVISASYLGSDNDNTGAGIEYKYPKEGSIMEKLQGMAAPTPGVIASAQVPDVAVQQPELPTDTEAPVIEHTKVPEGDAYKPIKIEAKVTDNLAVPLVTLHYKEKDAEKFTALSMNPNIENTSLYSAEIPAANVTSDTIYYIEATDGIQAEKTEEYTINIKKVDVDFSKVPHLLVTEVVPDSTNVGSADGYEFIEIYNNSNQDINFKDYKLYYRYGTDPGTDVVWPSVPEDVVIPAGETLVFWIINDQNDSSTVADFNNNYGSNLEENKNIVRIYTGGMANGSMRGIVVGTNTHKEVALAYYNDVPNVDDTYPDKGIVYGYPLDGTTQQVKLENNKDATPGTVEPYQVPQEAVQLLEDTTQPVIENKTDVTEVAEKDNIDIVANVTDDQEVKSVRLFYKTDDQNEFQMKILQQDSSSGLYYSTIYSPELIGKDYVDYYFTASDGRNEIASDLYQVNITTDYDQSSLRFNIKEDEIVSGEVVLKGTSAEDTPDNVSILLDNIELKSDTFQSVERTAYFALDVNGLNTYFQNAVTMGDEVLYLMDKDWLTQWKTFSIPIEPDRLVLGDNTITVRSGNKASPFDLESTENRDDYDLKNVRLVLSDGTVLTDPRYNNPDQVLKMNDANPFVDFHFTITDDYARSKTVKWDTTTVSDGEHVIKVVDSDETLETKILVDNTAPTIKTNLVEDKEYKGAFTIEGSATDEIAGVESFETYLDDKIISLPYETASSKLTPGTHKLTMMQQIKLAINPNTLFTFLL